MGKKLWVIISFLILTISLFSIITTATEPKKYIVYFDGSEDSKELAETISKRVTKSGSLASNQLPVVNKVIDAMKTGGAVTNFELGFAYSAIAGDPLLDASKLTDYASADINGEFVELGGVDSDGTLYKRGLFGSKGKVIASLPDGMPPTAMVVEYSDGTIAYAVPYGDQYMYMDENMMAVDWQTGKSVSEGAGPAAGVVDSLGPEPNQGTITKYKQLGSTFYVTNDDGKTWLKIDVDGTTTIKVSDENAALLNEEALPFITREEAETAAKDLRYTQFGNTKFSTSKNEITIIDKNGDGGVYTDSEGKSSIVTYMTVNGKAGWYDNNGVLVGDVSRVSNVDGLSRAISTLEQLESLNIDFKSQSISYHGLTINNKAELDAEIVKQRAAIKAQQEAAQSAMWKELEKEYETMGVLALWTEHAQFWGNIGFSGGDSDLMGLTSLIDSFSVDGIIGDYYCDINLLSSNNARSSFIMTQSGDTGLHIEGYTKDYSGYVSCDSANSTDDNPACVAAFGSGADCNEENVCGTVDNPTLFSDTVYMVTFKISGGKDVISEGETLEAVITLDSTIVDISGDYLNGSWNNRNDVMHIKSGQSGYSFEGSSTLYIPKTEIGGGNYKKACIKILNPDAFTKEFKAQFDEIKESDNKLCNSFVKKESDLAENIDMKGVDNYIDFFAWGFSAPSFDITKSSGSASSGSGGAGSSGEDQWIG